MTVNYMGIRGEREEIHTIHSLPSATKLRAIELADAGTAEVGSNCRLVL